MIPARYPNSNQFRKELEKKPRERVFLFLGEEEGEKDKIINLLIDQTLPEESGRAQSVGRYHIENGEFMPAADFALSSSMFSSSRVCVMRNINALKGGDSQEALFGSVIGDLPDSTLLIMTSTENRPPSFISSKALSAIKIVQFWKYFDKDLYHYIELSLKKIGLELEDRAVDALVELTGKDIKKIDEAIDMLHYSAEAGPVTADQVRGLIHDQRGTSVFEFLDLLFRRDRRVFRLLQKLLEEDTPELFILNRIQWQAESIEKYLLLVQGGASIEEALKTSGINQRNRDAFIGYSRTFPLAGMKKIFSLLYRADFQIKSGSPKKTLLGHPLTGLISDMILEK